MDLIEQVYENLSMQEGKSVIQHILQDVYFRPGISTKKLATRRLLPLPVVAAIKNELVKCGLIMQARGVYCTAKGLQYVRHQLGFLGLNESLYADIMREDALLLLRQQLEYELAAYFDNRPTVDVTIDQSHCTIETSISRAILCIRHHALVGKSILCVGDDDLVSLSLAMLLKKLFVSVPCPARIVVVDMDPRLIDYITGIAAAEGLPITCCQVDLRCQAIPPELGSFDCLFTDPPYTLQGLKLFLARGGDRMRAEANLPIFLSFAHKSPMATLNMQKMFASLGLSVHAIHPRFNMYKGASIIGNESQMIVLQTTRQRGSLETADLCPSIYTREVRGMIEQPNMTT